MSDDFKLSVSVEADLTRLDNSLNQAIAKTRAAGQQMQQAMSGGTGGYMGSTSLAGISPASPNMPGTPISWGNGLNVAAGNGMMPPTAGRAGMFGGLFNRGGAFGIGPSAAALAGVYAYKTQQQFNTAFLGMGLGGQNALSAAMRGDSVAMMSYQAQIEESMRSMPFVGGMVGSTLDNTRMGFRGASNAFGGQSTAIGRQLQTFGMDPRASSSAKLQAEQLRVQANKGIFGGGYYGQKEELQYKYGTLSARELQDMMAKGVDSATISDWGKQQGRNAMREFQELDIKRRNDLRTIKSATTQANMTAFGAGGLANILGIQTQFANEMAMTNPKDTERLNALKSLQSSQIMSEIMGNMQPAQAFTPGTMELGTGAVRAGSMRNQDSDTLRTLMNIGDKLGQFQPLVTR